ncbi:Late embryogenesis abundant protein [Melia azedarach]|uniref:Late embryogenesis abundant protein n=1 Tax=Melia azedarach TaxID=155640 RepID=A0ACC1Z1I0_MELAZ|nr:Late embryogenesis abundant protein [Melia azedarach]
MPTKLIYRPTRRGTHPLIWCAAIICTIVAIGVIVAGIVVFIGYIVIHPRVPIISVVNAHLDRFQFDPAGLLETQITIIVRMKNGNERAHASFSETSFSLSFDGVEIARLVADPFDVSKNSSTDFNYVAESMAIPLDPEKQEVVDLALKRDEVRFEFKGGSRARWRVGPLGSVKFWCHLSCQLRFHPLNGTYIPSRCSSKAK